jgi:hypothetical protein
MKTVIEMAKEAGLFTHKEVQPEIERFAELVRADERARMQPKKIKKVREDDYCQGDERYYANE